MPRRCAATFRIHAGEPAHIHRIGDHQSLETELLLQDSRDNRAGVCGDAGRIRFKHRSGNVRDHHGVCPGVNGRAEGWKIDLLNLFAGSIYRRHSQVRVGCRVAVSGKVLGRGQKPRAARAADIGAHQRANLRGIFSKRTSVDDRIDWVGIDVSNRHQVPLHADGARFLRHHAPKPLRQFRLAGGAERHAVRKHRGSIQAHGEAAFIVGSHKQRDFGGMLKLIDQHGCFIGLALGE